MTYFCTRCIALAISRQLENAQPAFKKSPKLIRTDEIVSDANSWALVLTVNVSLY